MDDTYVRWFLIEKNMWPLSRSDATAMNRRWIVDQEGAHPGFATTLRSVALEALAHSDARVVRAALSALAVVGTESDLVRVRPRR